MFIERPNKMAEVVLKTPPLINPGINIKNPSIQGEVKLEYFNWDFEKENEKLNNEIDKKIEWINKRRNERKEKI